MKKNKPQKGNIQYLTYRKKITIIRTFLLFLLAFTILMTGYLSTGSVENYLTIIGILGILPATRSAVEMIAVLRVKPINDAIYQKYSDLTAQSKLDLQYNLYFTTNKKNFSIQVLFVTNECIIGYTTDKKCNIKDAKIHIQTYMKKDGFTPKNVNVFSEESKFLLAIKNNLENKPSLLDSKMEHALKLLSI